MNTLCASSICEKRKLCIRNMYHGDLIDQYCEDLGGMRCSDYSKPNYVLTSNSQGHIYFEIKENRLCGEENGYQKMIPIKNFEKGEYIQ